MDHYAALGVHPSVSADEIRAAYRRKCAEHHPDRGGSHERMAEINAAWACLGDPDKRAAYDASRKPAEPETEFRFREPTAMQSFATTGHGGNWRPEGGWRPPW